MSVTSPSPEKLTLQENALAAGMLHHLGDATVRFAIGEDGIRYHDVPQLSPQDFSSLVSEFSRDPKESLAFARESLFAISRDNRLSKEEKHERLDRYLDAYFDLTIKLDNAAFPPTAPGEVKEGVPDYVPDGLVDMGGQSELDPDYRSREQILIDKRDIFTRYKPVLMEVFSRDFGDMPSSMIKRQIAATLASEIYQRINYENKDFGGGRVKLSEVPEGVCRHQGLVYQVLAQALGLKTRILKSYLDGGRHSTNMTRLDGTWYISDVTNPDYVNLPGGKREWRPGFFKVDGPPQRGERKQYDVVAKHSGKTRTYIAHDQMYWHIV